MNDIITLADPATSCDWAVNAALRAEALVSTLTVALASPCKAEIEHSVPALLDILREELARVRDHAESAADAIRQATP